MAWLWENYNPAGVYRVDWRPWAPPLEITDHDLYAVNILPRFQDIFLPLATIGEHTRAGMENALLHILALLDIAWGVDSREIGVRQLARELSDGLWGADVAATFAELNKRNQNRIAKLLYEQEESGIMQLTRAIKVFFPGCIAYKTESHGVILLALPSMPCQENIKLLNLIFSLFLPIYIKCFPLWGSTPCILDCSEACLDSTVVF